MDERTLTLCWGGHNALCLLVFWGAQAAWALFLCRFAMAHAAQTPFNDMSLFLAFFRNGFLHSLLPLQEYSRAIRNGIFLLCLGLTAALLFLPAAARTQGLRHTAPVGADGRFLFPGVCHGRNRYCAECGGSVHRCRSRLECLEVL